MMQSIEQLPIKRPHGIHMANERLSTTQSTVQIVIG